MGGRGSPSFRTQRFARSRKGDREGALESTPAAAGHRCEWTFRSESAYRCEAGRV